MRILLVEDEDRIASFIVKGLNAEGHTVERATTAAEASAMGTTRDFDLVLLDLLLPDGHGRDVLGRIRAVRPELPVVVLSALGDVDDKVELLDAGADDYLTKPFGVAELLARVRAALRRSESSSIEQVPVFRFGNVVVDHLSHRIEKAGTRLTVIEPSSTALPKIGKAGQWLAVKATNNQRGYVMAQYVLLKQ